MKTNRAVARTQRKREFHKRKRRIEYRNRLKQWGDQERPMFSAQNIHYESSARSLGLSTGGIGAVHRMVNQLGLAREIDQSLHLLQVHKPYFESDHVLNLAYNLLCGGTHLEDLEELRHDEAYVQALGAARIPDPTTAGDFCRRFDAAAVEILMRAVNRVRLQVWSQQPDSFFDEAILDADGTLVPTTGECKQGMDLSYKGEWGYQVLLLSLAQTGEPLFLVNRSGNRPSHEGAAHRFDQAIAMCRQAGFRRITLRGDTDFSQTEHLDRWDRFGVGFLFGYDANARLVNHAESLAPSRWQRLDRPPRYLVQTRERDKPVRTKEKIVEAREFTNIKLVSEDVAEFRYAPIACQHRYRMIVVRKNRKVLKGQKLLFRDREFFFYLTNDGDTPADELVFKANARCNQENLIEQLKNGARALRAPVDNLTSNWAYMVMGSLAWSLKAWMALLLPDTGRWQEKHRAEKESVLRMEFKKFVREFIQIPVQLIRTGRRILFRLLAWNRHQHLFLRFLDRIERPLRC